MSKGKRKTSVVAMMAVLASLLVPMALATTAGAAPPAGGVGAPSADFKICNGDVTGSEYLANPYGEGFICAEAHPTHYSGNGGDGWNEFDLVPFRLILTTGADEAQSYSFGVAADFKRNGIAGYDRLTVPSVNTALSTGTCNITSVGATQTRTPGFTAGTDSSIYRLVTISIGNSASCVIDYDARLAIGASEYPGASLHGNITDGTASGTNQDRSIQTGPIAPQEINKDMTAVRDVDHTWNITKSATPANINLGDTCATPNPTNSTVEISVVWTRGAATPSGMTHITANIYATNPAHRDITASIVDKVYQGTGQADADLIHTSAPFVEVIGHGMTELVGTDSFDTSSTATTFNDVATASYTDTVFNEPVPGQTTATATTGVDTGDELNASAVITDVESITGTGLSFSVQSVVDGNTGAGGAQALTGDTFERPVGTAYAVPGTLGTGAVTWTSGTVSASGSVTFAKTVKFTGSGDVSGSLNDTASFNTSDGVTGSANGTIGITTNTIATLTINKTTDLNVAANTVFNFTVTGPGGFSAPAFVTVLAGTNSASTTLGGLNDGAYLVTETDTPDWNEDAPQPFTIAAGECTDSVTFNNTLRKANIIVDKVTDPAGSTQSFDFTASYDADGFSLTDAATPNDSGPLAPGNGYSVAETVPDGWDLTSATCDDNSPITNISLQPGETVTCIFTNTKLGSITLVKETSPSPDPTNTSFSFTRDFGSSPVSLKNGGTDTVKDLAAGPYSASETVPAGWSLTSFTCDNGDDASAITLGVGEDITCTAVNTLQTGNIVIVKQTLPNPDPSGTAFTFKTNYKDDFALKNTESDDSGPLSLLGAPYSAAETVPTGWVLKSFTCDNGNSPSAITPIAGGTVTCTAVNEQQGHARVVKKFNGGTPPAGSSYTFTLRTGAAVGNEGTTLETLTFNDANGYDQTFKTLLVPGNTYQLCEQNVPVGGHSSLSDLPGAFSPGVSPADNSTQCAPFTVTAGETKTFEVNNTPPPGGDQRTIGYWKNWASCSGSNGKQAPKLDQTLYAATQAGKTIVIGTLPLPGGATANNAGTSCTYAINILNKTTIDGKKKMASDPLFNMAAQLLAAKLNVAAGAGTCATADQAIKDAQDLLVKYGWNGLTYSPKLTAADATKANNLNGILDQYNNGTLPGC